MYARFKLRCVRCRSCSPASVGDKEHSSLLPVLVCAHSRFSSTYSFRTRYVQDAASSDRQACFLSDPRQQEGSPGTSGDHEVRDETRGWGEGSEERMRRTRGEEGDSVGREEQEARATGGGSAASDGGMETEGAIRAACRPSASSRPSSRPSPPLSRSLLSLAPLARLLTRVLLVAGVAW